ncbi:unnamed protein product [Sphenostylis stenocarpa]|uniref:Pectinesterase inhibitor domain-containing protein n=1 Tax=Sphenostylis stenocarpa TaxID=92480 RepID=A0AA86T252_9FABA|nr:unnamed protein product [Sphenostylis stenocarpa]
MARNLSLVLLFLFVASSSAVQVAELDLICKKTQDPKFCFNLLNSRPGGTMGADLVDLAQYALDVTRANITITTKLIKRLIRRNPTNLEARDHYTICLNQIHKGAMGKVESTQEILKSGDYQDLNVVASGIRTHIDLCIDGESPIDTPYNDTSLLPAYANDISQAVEIIVIISNILYK